MNRALLKEQQISINMISTISDLIVKLDNVIKANEDLLAVLTDDTPIYDNVCYVIDKTIIARDLAYDNLIDAYNYHKRISDYLN